MEVLDGTDDLRGVEEACAIAEASPTAQVAKELASRHIVHQHVEEALVVVRPESGKQKVNVRVQLVQHKARPSCKALVSGLNFVRSVIIFGLEGNTNLQQALAHQYYAAY